MQLTANELTWETGSLGSNPSLSVFCEAKNGEVSPSKIAKQFWRADSPHCLKKQNGGSPSKVVMYYVYILLNEAKTRNVYRCFRRCS